MGFTWITAGTTSTTTGPSPRAWGLRPPPFCPAPGLSVHPHVRGVYSRSCSLHSRLSGPSPRAWGLRPIRPAPGPPCRSIPTCVGFTQWLLSNITLLWVHPHVRGVYTEIKSKISRVSIKTALLPAEKFKILFLVKIKGSAATFQVHTIFRDQSPPGLHFEIALHL